MFADDHPLHAVGCHIPLRRAGLPDEVLNAVVLLASGEASYITGASLVAVGDRSTTLPGSSVRPRPTSAERTRT